MDFTDECNVEGTGDGNNRRSVDAAFHESECRVAVGAGASVSGGAWRLYTPGRRLRESGVLFALKARLTTQAVRNNITMQATVVTVAASSASASITSVSFGAVLV